jgi:serine protease inhibitor
MRTSNAFSLALGSILVVGLSSFPNRTIATPFYAPLVAGNTDFALKMYGQMAAGNSGNIFFSPYSISACLGMVYEGAAGETAQQMAQALDFSTNQAAVGGEFGALQTELDGQQGQGGISLSVANGLWAQTNFPFLPSFLDGVTSNYDASLQQVNFATSANQITDQINQWVADKTADMITNLFAPGALKSSTELALVNAIYFKGGWANPFPTNATTNQPFYTSPGRTVLAPMMHQLEGVPYYQDPLLQAVELPYSNSNLVVVVLLPKATGSVTQLDALLSPQELAAALDGMRPRSVDVWLPRFKLAMGANLIPWLENLGMIDAFSPGVADFSGMDGRWDLFIDAVVHKAVVEVDETGTVAAGATGVGVTATVAGGPPNPTFRADHPFLFMIYDTNSASILFLGRVADPTTGGGASPSTLPIQPMIQTGDGGFGIRNNQFCFNISGTNATVVVEACTNSASGGWFPVQTLTLTNGSACFSEPVTTNSPGRFYRIRTQ